MRKINLVLCLLILTSGLLARHSEADSEDRKMKVFILSGQSNMVGWGVSANLPDSLRNGSENKLMFEDGKWQKLKPHAPANKGQTRYGLSGKTFGPEISFADEIASAYPEETIGIIKSATGGTGIMAWSPNWTREQADRTNDGNKGDLYTVLIDKVKAAQQAADIEIAGFLWKQGGKDMIDLSVSEEYFDNLKALITGLRRDLGLPDLPVFIGSAVGRSQLEQADEAAFTRYTKARPGIKNVFRAYFKAEENIPNVKVVEVGSLEKHPKNVHYNTNGQLMQGKLFAQAYLQFVESN